MNVIDVLRERGFIDKDENGVESITSPSIIDYVNQNNMLTCYAGFDPSAPSLHLGNLLVIMGLSQIQLCGHKPIVLIGGATGMIGDPSGKSEERNLLTPKQIKENIDGIRPQLERFLEFGTKKNSAIIVNNADWLSSYKLIEFLRDIGKNFRINDMLKKDSIKTRCGIEKSPHSDDFIIKGGNEGMSFTEFTYMLLQSYDFLYLYDNYGCNLQVGGSDQWGNITAGLDLIKRLRGKTVWGIVFPLLKTATGTKFGKTEQGTIWLDANKTSPYKLYQYLIQTDDRNVVQFLKLFTFLPIEKINELQKSVETNPEARLAQRTLAYEVTKIVHGETEAKKAVKSAEVLFGEEISGFTDRELEEIFADVPSTVLSKTELSKGTKIIELCKNIGLCKSINEARRLILSGGLYINNKRVTSVDIILNKELLVSEHIIILRSGKKNYHLLKFE